MKFAPEFFPSLFARHCSASFVPFLPSSSEPCTCFLHISRFVPPSRLRGMKVSSFSPLPSSFILFRRITQEREPPVSLKSTFAFLSSNLSSPVYEEKYVYNSNRRKQAVILTKSLCIGHISRFTDRTIVSQ